MKFDVIVGNPPYQRPNTKAYKLWVDFLDTALPLYKSNLYFITPSLIADGRSSQIAPLRKKIMPYLDSITFVKDNVFGVAEDICWYKLSKNRSSSFKMTLKDGSDGIINKAGIDTIDRDTIAASIIAKIEGTRDPKLTLVSDYSNGGAEGTVNVLKANNVISDTKTSTHCYDFVHSGKQRFFSSIESKYASKPKVLINYSSSFKDTFYDTDSVIGKQMEAVIVANKTEGENLRKILSSKLFQLYIVIEKTGGFNTGIYNLPALDLTKVWTDTALYSHFKLTQQEIDYVIENA